MILACHALERCDQTFDLGFPPIQLFPEQQLIRDIVSAQSEGRDVLARLPLDQAPSSVSFSLNS